MKQGLKNGQGRDCKKWPRRFENKASKTLKRNTVIKVKTSMHELNRILNTTENRVVQDSPKKDVKCITKGRKTDVRKKRYRA